MQPSAASGFLTSLSGETNLLDVDNYFEEFRKLLPPVDVQKVTLHKSTEMEFYANILDISLEEARALNDVTSVNNLQCTDDFEPFDHQLHENESDFQMKYEMARLTTSGDHDLKTLRKLVGDSEELWKGYNFRYRNYTWYPVEEFPDIRENLNPWDFSTLVYSIKIYHPFLSSQISGRKSKLLQEIHMLGDNSLSNLKDAITCTMDYNGVTDISNAIPENHNQFDVKKKDKYLSSFIFIENQFYNDTRNPSMRDLSEIIIKWANEKQIGFFTKGIMENTKLKDLKLRIGRPYIYQHQGDCEHILIVSDIRFLQVSDPAKTCNFPRVNAKGRSSVRYCMMCGISCARWLVTHSKRLTFDKTYFCTSCFKSYNYKDGEKIGDFKAYEYVDINAIQ